MIQFVFLEGLFCSFKLKGIVDKLLLKIRSKSEEFIWIRKNGL